MLSSKARGLVGHLSEPVARTLADLGVSADALTLTGLSGSVLAGALLGSGRQRLAGAACLLAAAPDMLDGAVAKITDSQGPWGAFLDSSVDRLSDAAVLTGAVYLAAREHRPEVALLATVGLTLSFSVSYTKARAESLGIACDVGFAERPERVLLLGFALLSGLLTPGLCVLVAGTGVTVAQRVLHVRKATGQAQ